MTKQRSQRHDREHREDEQQRVSRGKKFGGYQYHGHKAQQPERGIMAEFFEQRIHVAPSALGTQSSICSVLIDLAKCNCFKSMKRSQNGVFSMATGELEWPAQRTGRRR